ncbi:MAG: DUF2125 domain-containing protein, partial [Beijerinckiaceae bacterium]
CPDRAIDGYPFRIVLRCSNPTFRGEPGRRDLVEGKLGALTVIATTAGALSLAHVIAEAEGPLVVSEAGQGRMTMNWKTARASFRGTPSRLERVSLDMEQPTTVLSIAGVQEFSFSSEKLEAHVREGTDPANPDTYDVSLRLARLVAPPLDFLTGNRDAGDLELDGRVLRLATIDRRDWRASLETWRNAGGTFRVERLKLAKGAPRLEAKGDLQLDGERRLAGRLDAEFVNADVLLRQFGIGGNAGGILGALLGGGQPRAQTGATERSMRLPMTLGGGRISVGPFRVPGVELRPLY